MAAYRDAPGEKLNARQRAMPHLAPGFHTWRPLVCAGGLKPGDAVEVSVQAVDGAS
jgi:hypothetical protein